MNKRRLQIPQQKFPAYKGRAKHASELKDAKWEIPGLESYFERALKLPTKVIAKRSHMEVIHNASAV